MDMIREDIGLIDMTTVGLEIGHQNAGLVLYRQRDILHLASRFLQLQIKVGLVIKVATDGQIGDVVDKAQSFHKVQRYRINYINVHCQSDCIGRTDLVGLDNAGDTQISQFIHRIK